MELTQILKEVNDIFIEVLEIDDLKINNETNSDDIEDWDSLNHIQLVIAIEKHFKLRFTSQEISNWKNVGEMCEAIQKRVNA